MSSQHTNETQGTLKAIAHRPADGDPMQTATSCRIVEGKGIETENRPAGQREVTLLSVESWDRACRELGVDLPWQFRRANLLIEGLGLAPTVGKTIAVGDVRIRIHGESKPCGVMEKQQAGLKQALAPETRGGVFGQVIKGGTINVGDPVSICAE